MYTANYDYPKNVLRLDGADGGKLMELPLNVRFNYNGKEATAFVTMKSHTIIPCFHKYPPYSSTNTMCRPLISTTCASTP